MKNTDQKQLLIDALYETHGINFNLRVQNGSDRIIFGEGDINAKLMLIGEAPGATEDELMKPFVGRSGKLLNSALEAAGIHREQIFISNIVKTRPPNNRKPFRNELGQGRKFLLEQIKIIQPTVICTLGASALEGLLERKIILSNLRGKPIAAFGITIMPTFHPAYILRDMKKMPMLVQDLLKAAEMATQD